jgi:hypothetical protein
LSFFSPVVRPEKEGGKEKELNQKRGGGKSLRDENERRKRSGK